jgi:hypothetical protein
MDYGFIHRCHPLPGGGLPHSEITGSTPGCGSPVLIAAAHVLLRHSTPRHPPHAPSSFFLYPSSRGTWSPSWRRDSVTRPQHSQIPAPTRAPRTPARISSRTRRLVASVVKVRNPLHPTGQSGPVLGHLRGQQHHSIATRAPCTKSPLSASRTTHRVRQGKH